MFEHSHKKEFEIIYNTFINNQNVKQIKG